MPSTLLAPHAIEDYENNRTSLLASTGLSPKDLCDLDDQQLLQLQEQLLMGATWGMWEFPAKWGQAKSRTPGRRSYRLKLALPDNVDPQSEYGNRIWREVLRFTLALRLWPGPWGGLCKPGSIRTSVGVLGRIIRGLGASNEAPFWARIDRTVAREHGGKAGPTHANVLSFYHKMGALPDGPASTRRKGEQPRRDRSGEPEHTSSPDSSRQWMPFPDTYTAAAGWRALYMLREVGPTLMDALERVAALPIRTSTANGRPLIKSSVRVANKAQRDQVIAKWDWRSTDGTPLRSVPMKISMVGDGKRRHNISWPPETYADAMRLLYLVQASHLWVVALSLAGRHGEIAEMKVNCIRRETTTTPTGSFVTWKLEEVVGRESEAPLPSVVVFALQQQTRLAEIVRQTTGVVGDCLWVRASRGNSGKGGDPIFDLSSALLRFNSAFELGPLMENTNLHMHRFRKTLVRIVALALVHAPKILMDLLGHRDEQMTVMRYVLSDPGILAEIEEITREMVILKGLDAVRGRDHLQGKAAPILRARVDQYARLLGKNAFEPSNLREFVEVITEGGTGWAIIGPGKVCTGFRQGGLCNEGTGEANPHYCSPDCNNQLLFSEYEKADGTAVSAIDESINTLDYMVEELRRAACDEEKMLIAQFVGQVMGLLNHWPEVDEYFRDHHLPDPEINKHFPRVVLLP